MLLTEMAGTTADCDEFDQDVRELPPLLRWPLRAAYGVVGLCGLVGLVAFIILWVVFWRALRSGAATPLGDQVFRIQNHTEIAYVTADVHHALQVLQYTSFSGIGIAVIGGFALTALASFLHRRLRPSGPGVIEVVPKPRPPRLQSPP